MSGDLGATSHVHGIQTNRLETAQADTNKINPYVWRLLNHSVYNHENIYHCKGIRSFNRKGSQKKKITALGIRIAEPVVAFIFFFPSFVCMNQPNS